MAGCMRCMLEHIRRLKHNHIKYRQACRWLSAEEKDDVDKLLSLLHTCPWNHDCSMSEPASSPAKSAAGGQPASGIDAPPAKPAMSVQPAPAMSVCSSPAKSAAGIQLPPAISVAAAATKAKENEQVLSPQHEAPPKAQDQQVQKSVLQQEQQHHQCFYNFAQFGALASQRGGLTKLARISICIVW